MYKLKCNFVALQDKIPLNPIGCGFEDNQKLKRLGKLIGETLPLSSYTPRHSWATAARNHNIPVAVISAGMGHTSEKTTLIYLDSLDNSLIDNANNGILKDLNSTVSW